MDSRVPFTKSPDGTVVALGKRYPDLVTADKEVAKIIAKREAIARRPLTAKEIRDGVSPPDNRSERQRIADSQWQPKLPRTAKPDDNPFRDGTEYAERFDDPNGGKETREQFRQRSAREWDDKKAHAIDRTSPHRLAAIAEAESMLETLRYEPGVTQADVEHAERMVTQARVGDLAHFRAMRDAMNIQRIARYGDDAAKAQERVEQAQAEFGASQQRIAALRPPQEPQQGPPAYKPTNEFIRAGDKIVEWNGDKIVNRHDVRTCDPEIVTLAQ